MCGACCRLDTLLVTVTGKDLNRISQALGLSAGELLRALDFYVLKEDEAVPMGLRDIPRVNTERGAAYVALRKTPNGDCVFLQDNLCLIHAARPSACRAFPFVFQEDKGGLAWGLSAVKEICPGLGRGPQVSASNLYETGNEVLEEISISKEFIDEWNRNAQTPSAISYVEAVLRDGRFSV
ncbi:MAG: hypothetical protein C4K49_10890 [Candidatus Thorarchaeota archaeon]|nr:MAG: hypothetical protein C4K49_10890 [Candidatus Thorarchaeota archaeon]